MKPGYIRQVDQGDWGQREVFEWAEDNADMAREEGYTWFRVSYNPERRIYLFEGWKERPAEEGEPRWQDDV